MMMNGNFFKCQPSLETCKPCEYYCLCDDCVIDIQDLNFGRKNQKKYFELKQTEEEHRFFKKKEEDDPDQRKLF
jgi:hypothetical protein